MSEKIIGLENGESISTTRLAEAYLVYQDNGNGTFTIVKYRHGLPPHMDTRRVSTARMLNLVREVANNIANEKVQVKDSFELTDIQKKHLPSIQWLLSTHDEDTGTGRSTLIALALLQQAKENPGQDIHVFSHWYTRASIQSQIRTIINVFRATMNNQEWELKVPSGRYDAFKLVRKNKKPNLRYFV